MASGFGTAVTAGDAEAIARTLHPDIRFRSPIVFRTYEGRDAVMQVLSAVGEVFEDFRYVDELHGDDTTCLVFQARVGNRELDGIDYLRHGPDGLVTELTVMVRPYSAATALRDAMGTKLAAASNN